jgi:hypothetical protein
MSPSNITDDKTQTAQRNAKVHTKLPVLNIGLHILCPWKRWIYKDIKSRESKNTITSRIHAIGKMSIGRLAPLCYIKTSQSTRRATSPTFSERPWGYLDALSLLERNWGPDSPVRNDPPIKVEFDISSKMLTKLNKLLSGVSKLHWQSTAPCAPVHDVFQRILSIGNPQYQPRVRCR